MLKKRTFLKIEFLQIVTPDRRRTLLALCVFTMKPFFKELSWFALVLCISLVTRGSMAGTNVSSGNGRGIVFQDGHVRFLDMLSDQELSQVISTGSALDVNQVWERYFAQKRFVKMMATPKSKFFACAISKLTPYAKRMPVLQSVLDQLDGVQVYEVKFPFMNSISEGELDRLDQNFPLVSAPSERVRNSRLQQPLAIYAKNTLVVSKFTEMLPSDDRCALEIHEVLRFLNNNPGLLDHPLTTPQVENLTRYFMGLKPLDEKSYDNAIMDLLNGFSPKDADSVYHYYGKMMAAIDQKMDSCRYAVEDPRWQALAAERQRYWDKRTELAVGKIGFLVGQPMAQQIDHFGILGAGGISDILTKPLPFGFCWDIKSQNKVSCLR
jgi:hypothetical protein